MIFDPFVTFIGLCIGRWAFSMWQGDATREAIWFLGAMLSCALWLISLQVAP
jgi:hypothetical protein